MEQLALKRPDRPLTAVKAAILSVEATANRDPEHLRSLVQESFEKESKSLFVLPTVYDDHEGEDVFPEFDPTPRAALLSPISSAQQRGRRGSVSAESYDPAKGSSTAPMAIPKTASERARLEAAVTPCLLFRGIAEATKKQIIEAMFERKVRAGEDIIRQGDLGDNFYVVESGSFAILIEGAGEVNRCGPGQSFGELALMYNQPRQATVRALEDSCVWGLDGATFRKVIIDVAYRRRLLHKDLLARVPLLSTLSPAEHARIAEALVPVSYAPGETILRQGESGQEFFILAEGRTDILIDGQLVNSLVPGDFFGELALLTNEPRTATVVAAEGGACQCLVLSRSDFNRLMGPLLPYLERNREQYKQYQQYIQA